MDQEHGLWQNVRELEKNSDYRGKQAMPSRSGAFSKDGGRRRFLQLSGGSLRAAVVTAGQRPPPLATETAYVGEAVLPPVLSG